MFDLENELQVWKQRVSQLETLRYHDVEELESHLRDSITELTKQGLSEQEAFFVAIRRVGDPNSLEHEFGKVNGRHVWATRVFWMLAGFLVFEVYQMITSAMASLAQVVTACAGGNGTEIGVASAGVTVFCWVGLALWLQRRSADGNDTRSLGKVLVNSPGKAIGIGIVLVCVVATLTKFASQISVVKITPVNELGQAARILAWSNAALTVLIPVGFLMVMLAIRARTRREFVMSTQSNIQ